MIKATQPNDLGEEIITKLEARPIYAIGCIFLLFRNLAAVDHRSINWPLLSDNGCACVLFKGIGNMFSGTQRRDGFGNHMPDKKGLDGLTSRLALRSIAAFLSHEINHPLGTIANRVSLLERRIQDSVVRPSELAMHLAAIRFETERAADVIKQLRILAGGMQGNVKTINCRAFLRDAAARFLQGYPLKNIDVVVSLQDREITMEGAAELLHIVLNNLMVNGLEAALHARVHRPSLVLSAKASASLVEIEVIDNGGGVDPELGRMIFDPFVTSKKDGSGLGLAICRDVVEWHGGALSFESVSFSNDEIAVNDVQQGGASSRKTGTIFRLALPSRRHGRVEQ